MSRYVALVSHPLHLANYLLYSAPFEPVSALTALDLKLLSHSCSHFFAPTYVPQSHSKVSREAPALITTSPIIHLNDIAPPPTGIKFDIPLIGSTAFCEEAVLLAVCKLDVQIEISQPRAPEESASDVSTLPLLSSCRCSDLCVCLSLCAERVPRKHLVFCFSEVPN